MSQVNSEVARLLAEIEATNLAMFQGMYGLSCGAARHEFINASYGRFTPLQEQLASLVGEDQSIALIYPIVGREPSELSSETSSS